MPYTPPAHAPFTVGGTADNSDLNAMNTGITNAYTQLESITANDGTAMPGSNGPWTLANFVNYFASLIKAITGAANWRTLPSTSIAALSSGKLDASSYTAADVKAKLLTVDGAGSGVDADLLDGISSTGFVRTGAGLTGKFDAQGSPPAGPSDGDLWLDTSVVL